MQRGAVVITCDCANDWRLELLDLETGNRIGWLPFIRFDFEELLNQVGTATITVPVRKVSLGDVWPHLRAVAFTRIAGPNASPTDPFCEFIGMIETVSAQSSGEVTIGLVSIEGYLKYRVMPDGTYTDNQTTLGADAVNLAAVSGARITGTDAGSITSRTVVLEAASDTLIIDFVDSLTQMQDGPDYSLTHTFASGAWSTVMKFSDYAGSTTARNLNAKRGLVSYGITVEAAEHGNYIRGRDQALGSYVATGVTSSIYVPFGKFVKYSDITDSTQLADQTNGELAQNAHPIATPDVTIADLGISGPIRLGDSLNLNMDHGAILYKGEARVTGKAWSSDTESPTLCTLSMVPLDDVTTTILNAPAGTGPGCC